MMTVGVGPAVVVERSMGLTLPLAIEDEAGIVVLDGMPEEIDEDGDGMGPLGHAMEAMYSQTSRGEFHVLSV
jgi:hypothetical protein